MAHIEGCKHELEIEIPAEEVVSETDRVVKSIQSRAKLQGFRPGKAPESMIRRMFSKEIRQDVVENLVPRFFRQRVDAEQLQVVGSPSVTDVSFEEGQPIRFKAEFEVAPEIELKDYRGLRVTYAEPVVTDADVEQRLEALRNQKADYVNLDPHPAEPGDVAVIDLHSTESFEGEPIHGHSMQIELDSPDTLEDFKTNLIGMSPGEEKTFSVQYPEEYGQERLAGKKVEFHAKLKMLQRKEMPELNDEFAKDLGDFQSLEELKETIRRNTFREREIAAQRVAKEALVDQLVEMHDFPIPEAYVDRQIELYIDRFLQEQAAQGRDPEKFRLDPSKVKAAMREKAVKEVKGSLLIDRIAEREAIGAMKDEVDQEVQRYARQEREPVAAVRKRWEENGTMNRIAHAIRTEKTLNYLFEHARKEAPPEGAGSGEPEETASES